MKIRMDAWQLVYPDGLLYNTVGELGDALKLPAADFEAKYGKPLPGQDQEVMFHCKLGGRAQKAAEMAQSLGFNK